MIPTRRNSCDESSSPQYSPKSSPSSSAANSDTSEQETLRYVCDFLDTKLAGNGGTLVSRLLTSETLLELNAKDVLDQELKMKSELTTGTTNLAVPGSIEMDNLSPPSKKPRTDSRPNMSTDHSSNATSGRRYRTQFTQTQLELLETTFQAQNYPSSTLRQQVHEMTGIPKESIKVWFQNRRAREKRMKLRHQRLNLSSTTNNAKTLTKTPSPPTASHPVPMTTMHWNDGESTTASSSIISAPPPMYNHAYHSQWNVPGAPNRQKWYWANAYHPYDTETGAPTAMVTASSGMPSMNTSGMHPVNISNVQSLNTSSMQSLRIPSVPFLNPSSEQSLNIYGVPSATSSSTPPLSYNSTMSPPQLPQQDPPTSSSSSLSPVAENLLNTGLHPWSANVLTSL